MDHYLDREGYKRLIGDPAGDEYPKGTAAAVLELRARGLDADARRMHYFITSGRVPEPAKRRRELRWTRGHIDRVAQLMAEEGWLTPQGWAWKLYTLHPAQDIEAQRQALRDHQNETVDTLVLTILPGAEGAGVYASAVYRPMTPAEASEWSEKVELAGHEA